MSTGNTLPFQLLCDIHRGYEYEVEIDARLSFSQNGSAPVAFPRRLASFPGVHSLRLIFATAILIEFLWEIRTCPNSNRISRNFISNRVFSMFFSLPCPFSNTMAEQRPKRSQLVNAQPAQQLGIKIRGLLRHHVPTQ